MFIALTGLANPQLDTGNATGFFTNVAAAMFKQMDLRDFNGNLVTITNIPIYEDPTLYNGTNISYYTPAVHRILQLAANIFDATTNRFIGGGPTNYPTVFRPIFNSQNGIVSIVGYQEVIDDTPALLFEYWDASKAAATPGPLAGINIYGVPWVIGAKKGFPNFNEFSINNPLLVSRDLQFSNQVPTLPWITNQIYNFSITNSFGIEAWNSYTNAYGRPLRMVISNTMSINITNEFGLSLLSATNLPFGIDTNFTGWPGWSATALSDSSFKVPLALSLNFTNGLYHQDLSFTHINPLVWTAAYQPHLWMSLQFKLQYILIDTSVNRVIDFVNLASVQPPVDIIATLDNTANGGEAPSSSDAQWDTNSLNGILGLSHGIQNQIDVGQLNIDGRPDFNSGILADKQQASLFRRRLGGFDTNSFRCPYSSHRVIYQMLSWQANDPLVHYTTPDLTSTNGILANLNLVTVLPPLGSATTNLLSLNFAYQPWGGYHVPNGGPIRKTPFDYDVRVKDPGVQQSDNWDFPSGEPLSFEWLGRVHRGTPWQTIFLKPSNQLVNDWRTWCNDNVLITNGANIFIDAAYTHPTNDWRIASLWACWLNTNDLSTLLSLNNPDPNASAARLDGLIALTNSASGELDPMTITSNSPPAEIIAQAIQTIRIGQSNYFFHDLGDILATPQLSVASPFLNTNAQAGVVGTGLSTPGANGLNDEAFEKIPTQLLPLLRLDSVGEIEPANGQLKLSFSGYDGHAYAIEASSNLADWTILSTNFPADGTFSTTNTAPSDRQFYRSVLLH